MPAASPAAPRPRFNLKVLIAGSVLVLPLIAILFFNLGRDPHAIHTPLIGTAAPSFALPPVAGGAPVSLESMRGHPVVLNFWATWCVPCVAEQRALSAAAGSYGDTRFLGVVYEDEDSKIDAYLKERPTGYPSLLDPGGRAAIAYGVFGVPETFFIDAEGRIVEKFVGPLDTRSIDLLVARAGGGR